MKILVAKEQESGTIFSLEELSKFKENDIRLKNLVCPNCGCELSYYPEGVKKAFLKTRNNSKHDESCEYYFVSIDKELLASADGVLRYKMNAKEKRERALDARKKLLKKDKKIEKIISRKGKNPNLVKKKTEKTLVEKRAKIQLVRDVKLADTNVSYEMVKGKIRIIRKHADEINSRLIGKTINLMGFLEGIHFDKSTITLDIGYEGESVQAVLTESFLTSASNNFPDLLKLINENILRFPHGIDVIVAGEIIQDSNGIYLSVYEEDDLYLCGKRTVQLAAQIVGGGK
ncbi:hypothetical protein CF160_11340 [Enterococcus pseudoavium]|nr:hypothetical protein CF160_11340 [Enterococcus pseudoavium]